MNDIKCSNESNYVGVPPHIPGKIYPLVGIVRLVKDPPAIMSRLHVNWLSKIDEPVYNIPGAYEWCKKHGGMPWVYPQEWVDRVEEFSDGWQRRIRTFVPFRISNDDFINRYEQDIKHYQTKLNNTQDPVERKKIKKIME